MIEGGRVGLGSDWLVTCVGLRVNVVDTDSTQIDSSDFVLVLIFSQLQCAPGRLHRLKLKLFMLVHTDCGRSLFHCVWGRYQPLD